MSQRVKGSEIQLIISTDGVLEETFTTIRNFELTEMLEVKSVGYLGENTERKDDIFKGSKFSFEMHVSRIAWWAFKKKVKDRAKRITPDTKFSISGIFVFPNGETIAETLDDCFFGELPQTVPSREEYFSVKLQGEVQDDSTQTF